MSLQETKKKDGCKGIKGFSQLGVCQCANCVSVRVCACDAVWYGVGAAVDVTKTRFLPFLSLTSYLHTYGQVGHTGLGVCAHVHVTHTQKHPHIGYTLAVSDPLPLARPTSPLPVRAEEQDHLGQEEKEVRVLLYVPLLCFTAGTGPKGFLGSRPLLSLSGGH